MMQRLALTQIGEPVQSLELQTGDEPTPGPGEALVEMEAATINTSDFLYATGQYFLTPTPGTTIGSEGVGRVVAVGPDTNTALIGRRVALLPTYRHGTWATHVTALAADLIAVPDDVDALQLAMVGINPMTALRLTKRSSLAIWPAASLTGSVSRWSSRPTSRVTSRPDTTSGRPRYSHWSALDQSIRRPRCTAWPIG